MIRSWEKFVLCLAATGLLGGALFAQDGAQPKGPQGQPMEATLPIVFRGVREDLEMHPFEVGGMTITLGLDHQIGGNDFITLHAFNHSNHFLKGDPWDLVVVRSGGDQSSIDQGNGAFPIAPGASACRSYWIRGCGCATGGVQLTLPAKIYYGERLVAVITDPPPPEPGPVLQEGQR